MCFFMCWGDWSKGSGQTFFATSESASWTRLPVDFVAVEGSISEEEDVWAPEVQAFEAKTFLRFF